MTAEPVLAHVLQEQSSRAKPERLFTGVIHRHSMVPHAKEAALQIRCCKTASFSMPRRHLSRSCHIRR